MPEGCQDFLQKCLLIDIEAELHSLDQWQHEPPTAKALASTEPFCIDTLNFSQWLQFVFLVRMHTLIKQRQALPGNCSIAPMAQEYFSGLGLNAGRLIVALEKLDRRLSQ